MTSGIVIDQRLTHFKASPRYLHPEPASHAVQAPAPAQYCSKIVATTSARLAMRSATVRDCSRFCYEVPYSLDQRQIKPISDGTAPYDIHRCSK